MRREQRSPEPPAREAGTAADGAGAASAASRRVWDKSWIAMTLPATDSSSLIWIDWGWVSSGPSGQRTWKGPTDNVPACFALRI